MKKLMIVALVLAGALAAVPADAGHVRIYPSVGIHLGYWGSPYWRHPYPYSHPYSWYGPRWGGYTVVYPNEAFRHGALDTDISPERAEVWIDGRRVGVADDFDGFPDYLWLEKGTYDVVFYLPGYKTLARQYSIYPGLVIDVEDRLERGEAIHPTELGPTSHERRDERLRRDRETAQELEQRAAVSPPVGGAEAPLDARAEPGRLLLSIRPADASVYLDGRFLGTGAELARLRAGLVVDAGEHVVQVVRPGREEHARHFAVESGGELRLAIELDEE